MSVIYIHTTARSKGYEKEVLNCNNKNIYLMCRVSLHTHNEAALRPKEVRHLLSWKHSGIMYQWVGKQSNSYPFLKYLLQEKWLFDFLKVLVSLSIIVQKLLFYFYWKWVNFAKNWPKLWRHNTESFAWDRLFVLNLY